MQSFHNVLNSIHSSNDLDIVISDRDKRLKDLRDRLDDVTSAQKDPESSLPGRAGRRFEASTCGA